MFLDAVWISIAFVWGLAARLVGLPPLVGYLAAGFALLGFGIHPGEIIDHFAEMGVTILLFTIGLKLRVDTLLRPQVWGSALAHMGATTLALGAGFMALAATSLPLLAGLPASSALLLGFALSYSSTVFAVKVFEEKGESDSVYARTAIGVLIMQDIVAVVFLALSTGKVPTVWALALLVALVPLRRVLWRLMDQAGHEELLILFGLSMALGGAQVFDLVGIKGDLGALILGVLLSRHRDADELSKSLLGFKNLFLVGFFLSIGLKGLPSLEAVAVGAALVAVVPVKGALFFGLLTRFRMRSRTAFLSSLGLSNYSEFGLIVATVGVANGWLTDAWLTTLALALSISFVAASPLNKAAYTLYERWQGGLARFQRAERLPEEAAIETGDATVLVFGMGRVGTQAYDTIARRSRERVLGLDVAPEVVAHQRSQGREVIRASATDSELWARLDLEQGPVRLILLALPHGAENAFIATLINRRGYTGRIGALVEHDDELELLSAAGIHRVFSIYDEAGAGFAADACRDLIPLDTPTPPADAG